MVNAEDSSIGLALNVEGGARSQGTQAIQRLEDTWDGFTPRLSKRNSPAPTFSPMKPGSDLQPPEL